MTTWHNGAQNVKRPRAKIFLCWFLLLFDKPALHRKAKLCAVWKIVKKCKKKGVKKVQKSASAAESANGWLGLICRLAHYRKHLESPKCPIDSIYLPGAFIERIYPRWRQHGVMLDKCPIGHWYLLVLFWCENWTYVRHFCTLHGLIINPTNFF